MKLKIRLSNNKIIAGALMSIALINTATRTRIKYHFHADSRQCRTCHCWAV